MMWPLSIDEEHGLKQPSQAPRIAVDIHPAEEVTNLDLDSTNEEAQAAETKRARIANTATSANSRDIGRRNAKWGSRKTSPAEMPKDEHTGQGYTSWMKMQKPNLSMPLITPTTKFRMMTKNMSSIQLELILIESISQEPQPFPSKIWVFSKELDDSPHSSS
jgi:hypothetical protein